MRQVTTITPEQVQRIENAKYQWLLKELICDEYGARQVADLTTEQAAAVILDIERWEAAE